MTILPVHDNSNDIIIYLGQEAALISWSQRPGSGRWWCKARRGEKVVILIIIIIIIIVTLIIIIIIIFKFAIIPRGWEVLQFQFFSSWHLERG